jgi:hypothetical protein
MRTLKRNGHFGDIGVHGIMVLKLISEELGVGVCGLDSTESRVVYCSVVTTSMNPWISLQERNFF